MVRKTIRLSQPLQKPHTVWCSNALHNTKPTLNDQSRYAQF
jgi:hypothetical protein